MLLEFINSLFSSFVGLENYELLLFLILAFILIKTLLS